LKISRYNYPAQFGDNADVLLSQLREMLLTGRYILGSEVTAFETAFAHYLGVQLVCGVNCGTDAIALTLSALGVKIGDEVITQANTFNATVTAIRIAGATPVLVDAEENGFLMDVSQVPDAMTSRTQVLLPVHLYGKPLPMDALVRLAHDRGIYIIEDAAQAHGAKIDGKKVGTFGIAGCFSFHPSKNLAAAGDAGAVVTNDIQLAYQLQLMRSLGQRAQNEHLIHGMNSKLDSLQAAVLLWKLPRLDAWNARRRLIAGLYRECLNGLPLSFQSEAANEEHVYHLFQIRTDRRDALLEHLLKAGVDAVIRYPTPIHLQPAFADCGWKTGQFPVAELLARELICLPIRPDMQIDEVHYVAESTRSFFGG
jgi:dTDP-4-amino-4,6-dideoxygalactose transaminase